MRINTFQTGLLLSPGGGAESEQWNKRNKKHKQEVTHKQDYNIDKV
jgi:hypothetical protein